jgi:hypothetical protein
MIERLQSARCQMKIGSFKCKLFMHAFYVALSVLFFATSCRTIPREDIAAFASGVSQAKEQTGVTFRTLNELSRESLINYVVTQPTLNDKLFVVVLDAESVANWERAFAGLEAYAGHLMTLTSANLTKEYREYAVKLAEEMKTTGEALKNAKIIPDAPQVSAPLAASFTKIGEILIRARAQSKAKEILRQVDPEIQRLFANMADAIGSTRSQGLRGTAWTHWTQQKATQQTAFLQANGIEQKRPIVVEFVELRDKQLTHDTALASLERSLRALSNAHHALSEGRNVDAASALALIKTEVEDTKKLYEEFKSALKPKE